jgi:flagellar biosynthesis chaperone FliJ
MSIGAHLLNQMLQIAKRKRDQASITAFSNKQKLATAKNTEDLLENFEQEQYAKRRNPDGRPLARVDLSVTEAFHRKLRDARRQQSRERQSLERISIETQTVLIERQSRVKAIEALQAQRRKTAALAQIKTERRESDELSANQQLGEF